MRAMSVQRTVAVVAIAALVGFGILALVLVMLNDDDGGSGGSSSSGTQVVHRNDASDGYAGVHSQGGQTPRQTYVGLSFRADAADGYKGLPSQSPGGVVIVRQAHGGPAQP